MPPACFPNEKPPETHCADNPCYVLSCEKGATTTSRFIAISIYYGIKTGFNEAFIIDQATRDALVAEDPVSAEILKPILRGRDVARYRANWAGLWLVDTHNGYAGAPPVNVEDYPAIKAHLGKFIDRLTRRQDKGITPYNLRNCAYHEEFGKPKLFWMHMAPEGRFALGQADIMCNQKCFMITGENLRYLCAVLNSSLVTWLVRKIAVTTGMGLTQWDKFVVESVPVVRPEDSAIADLGSAVTDLFAMLGAGDPAAVVQLDRQIDRMVFDLYEFTPQEINVLIRNEN